MKTTLTSLRQLSSAYDAAAFELKKYRELYLAEHSIYPNWSIVYHKGVKYQVVSSNVSEASGIVCRCHPYNKKGQPLSSSSRDKYFEQRELMSEKLYLQSHAQDK